VSDSSAAEAQAITDHDTQRPDAQRAALCRPGGVPSQPFFFFDDAFRRVATYYFANVDETAWGMFFRARRLSDFILASFILLTSS
jgi:hypothetical protein